MNEFDCLKMKDTETIDDFGRKLSEISWKAATIKTPIYIINNHNDWYAITRKNISLLKKTQMSGNGKKKEGNVLM